MRKVIDLQMGFWKKEIADIKFDLQSRDEIPKLLMGLQHIYSTREIRDKVFNILKCIVLLFSGFAGSGLRLRRGGLFKHGNTLRILTNEYSAAAPRLGLRGGLKPVLMYSCRLKRESALILNQNLSFKITTRSVDV